MEHPSFEDVKMVDRHLSEIRMEYFIHENLFTFQWWLLVILMLLPWAIFFYLVNRKSLIEILFYGSLISSLTVLLDDIGVELQLWSYKYQFVKLIPRLNPVDYCILPVFYMLIYQYFRSWKSFISAMIIFSAFASFIAEPLFIWLDIYIPTKWEHWYSFPCYILLGIFVKALLQLLLHTERCNQS
ncbi:hypothetical protein FZW96_18625 [Bacillus sp. BGMRC 2118]|nr:hypothetical protein FZW96_18625 [Bacillus sp. BGMRC 2118]